MRGARYKLADVLRQAIALLSRQDNDFAWSSWGDADAAVRELAGYISQLDAGRLPDQLDLQVVFAPTGPMQEVSLSSGWAQEFLDLAARFDVVQARVYRWNALQTIGLKLGLGRRAR